MIKGEEDKQYCKNCKRGPLRREQYIFDFYNMVHCGELCLNQYKKYREEEYDNYVDPSGYYRAKAKSEWD